MKLAFYKPKDRLFNRIVAWWTHGEYSHVEIAIHQNAGGMWWCGSSSNRDGGVRRKYLDLTPDKWDLLDYDGDEAEVTAWFDAHSREKYDLLGLFGFFGRRGTQDQKKWFCSEAVAAALGLNEPWRYDPNSLFAAVRGFYHGMF